MKLKELANDELHQRLRVGLGIRSGPFVFNLQANADILTRSLGLLYAEHELASTDEFTDYFVALRPASLLRRFIRPQVTFLFDGFAPFYPLPAAQAFASFEWGLNWVISNNAHQYLILHAAVVAKGQHALVLPGEPGAGKSTLCAAMMLSGWRLLSDELTLIDLASGRVWPLCRPVSLKNASIPVIGETFRDAVIGPVVDATAKGRVTHVKPTLHSIEMMDESASIRWFVFPHFRQGAETTLASREKAASFLEVGKNAFNYSFHQNNGLEAMKEIISGADCYSLTYSDLASALAVLDALAPPERVDPEVLSCHR